MNTKLKLQQHFTHNKKENKQNNSLSAGIDYKIRSAPHLLNDPGGS